MIINKIPSYSFCKSINQNEILKNSRKIFKNISVEVSPLELSAYYYTYRYDRKNEIYCVM